MGSLAIRTVDLNSYGLCGAVNSLRFLFFSLMGTYQNLLLQSKTETHLDPNRLEHWQSLWIKFRRRVKDSKINTKPILLFSFVVFFGNRIAGDKHVEFLSLIIHFSSTFSTWTFISCLSAYRVRYWGRQLDKVSPTCICCSMKSIHFKPVVLSSWNTCTYFSRIGSISCLSSCERWFSFPRKSLRYKASFFACGFNWCVLILTYISGLFFY